ncbi:MFS transporter [bacterium]|nr:MFS transporter [bacterium]
MIHPSRAGFREGLAAFQFRNFRLFWFGQLVSLVGTWMQSTAQSWLVLQLSDSPLAVGLVWAFQFTPVTVLSMLGGVFADRRNKRRVLIVTQSLAALQALTLSLLTLTGHITVGWVLGLAAMLGLINAFDVPTRQAFVVELVGRDALMNAIAFNSSAFNAARILGPAVGGVLIASLSAGGVFLINAASYLAVIAGLVMVREAELTARPERVRERIVQSLKAGLDYVRHAPSVLLAIFLVGVVATFGMNFTVLLPVMARDVFDIGAQGFGMLMAAYGVGSVGAGLFLAFRSRLDPRRSMLWGGAGVAVLGLAFALSPWLHALPLSVALLFGVGFAAITLTATANTSIQRRVPDALRGRVMAVYITVFSASVPLGSLFAGGLAKGWGAPFSLGAGAVLSGVGVLWAALRLHPAAEADSSPAA